MQTETSDFAAPGRLYSLGNRAEESNSTLGQFLRTRLGMQAFQRPESSLDSCVDVGGRCVVSDE